MSVIHEQYLTLAEAADRLKVSRSTLWRWIRGGDLPAYRLGRRRMWIKQADIDRLMAPARSLTDEGAVAAASERLSRPLTSEEQAAALAALDSARQFKASLFERHGGAAFPDSTEILRELRDERTRYLQ